MINEFEKLLSMNEIMRWLAHYNTLVIQVIFTIVLVLLAVYVYRLFYVPQSSTDGPSGQADLNEVSQKLTTLMKSGGVLDAARAESSFQGTAESSSDPESKAVLKAEINRLKEQLNEAEKKIFELTPTGDSISNDASASTSSSVATEAAFGIDAESTASPAASDKAASQVQQEMQKTIDQLQARLDEYDIISEDIAELSQLRSENSELRKKLEALGSAPVAPPEDVATSPAEEDIVVSEIEAPATDVADFEKNLMSEFEKSTEKGS